MQLECIAVLKEGVLWDDVHVLAHKILIDGLLELGILKGDKDEILASRTSVAFLPHGLGHYLGMNTHDTGGNPNYADKDPMFRYLRVRGTLPANSVITVEPGIYFCNFIIEPFLKDEKHAKYIDAEVLERYWLNGNNTVGRKSSTHTKIAKHGVLVRVVGVAASIVRVHAQIMPQTVRKEGDACTAGENLVLISLKDAQFQQAINGNLVGQNMDVIPENIPDQRQVHQGEPGYLRHCLEDAAGMHCRVEGGCSLG